MKIDEKDLVKILDRNAVKYWIKDDDIVFEDNGDTFYENFLNENPLIKKHLIDMLKERTIVIDSNYRGCNYRLSNKKEQVLQTDNEVIQNSQDDEPEDLRQASPEAIKIWCCLHDWILPYYPKQCYLDFGMIKEELSRNGFKFSDRDIRIHLRELVNLGYLRTGYRDRILYYMVV